MRSKQSPILAILALVFLSACSSVEVHPDDPTAFAKGNYQYYSWRSMPLSNTSNSTDPTYRLDPALRAAINKSLQAKGYKLDAERAQFTVDYRFAEGVRSGVKGTEASNLSTHPGVVPNRTLDQASIDNAYALGSLKETHNIGIQFNDVKSNKEVWQVIITKMVDNVNVTNSSGSHKAIDSAISQGMRALPQSSQSGLYSP